MKPAYGSAHYTYGDYRQWGGDERWELIEGEVFDMTPAPSRKHQQVAGALFVQLYRYFRNRRCEVYTAPFDVRLPEHEEADDAVRTVVQPDISIICDQSKLDDNGCRGAPDWIIEVLSPATAAKDQVRKLALYEKHGVREYWLVHPVERVVTRYSLVADATYGRPEIAETRGIQSSALFADMNIDWDEVFQ